jgi:hypothetical protein
MSSVGLLTIYLSGAIRRWADELQHMKLGLVRESCVDPSSGRGDILETRVIPVRPPAWDTDDAGGASDVAKLIVHGVSPIVHRHETLTMPVGHQVLRNFVVHGGYLIVHQHEIRTTPVGHWVLRKSFCTETIRLSNAMRDWRRRWGIGSYRTRCAWSKSDCPPAWDIDDAGGTSGITEHCCSRRRSDRPPAWDTDDTGGNLVFPYHLQPQSPLVKPLLPEHVPVQTRSPLI